MIQVGLIGYGYWGPNLARNIHAHEHLNLHTIAEKKEEKHDQIRLLYPNLRIVQDAHSIVTDNSIDVVVIATSVHQHLAFARLALENNKHVLIEKPAGTSLDELKALKELAIEKGKVIMVDYTFLYHGAVQKLKHLVDSDSFGKLNYIDSMRINLGIFQSDVNVVWDLASHDVAIVNYLVGKTPISVRANGVSHTANGIENIAYLLLAYEDQELIVHLNCSWSSPVKIRKMLCGGDRQMIIYDDVEPTDKIKVYDCDLSQFRNREEVLIDYRTGDISIPKFDTKEALSVLMNDLYLAISTDKNPASSIHVALNVTKVLDAAQQSIKNGGIEVRIK